MPKLVLAAIATLCLCLSSPSAASSWAGLLVLPGLMAFYALLSRPDARYRWAYCIGLIYYLSFSWSLRHVTWVGYVAICLLGPVYEMLSVSCLRAAGKRFPRALCFAIGIAAGQWLRANMPEINYPHGQWAHALFAWPGLLGPVSWAGEVFANGLLAWLAAALVDGYRSWRLAEPSWRSAGLGLSLPVLLWSTSCLVSPRPAPSPAESLRIGLVEPGDGEAFRFDMQRFANRFEDLLLEPTRQLVEAQGEQPLDLILWPEGAGSWPMAAGRFQYLWGEQPRWQRPGNWPSLDPRTRLLLGTSLLIGEQQVERYYAVAALFDAAGELVDWQEKRRPVPAGESLPLVSLLPAFLEDPIRDWMRSLVGTALDMRAGRERPMLETAGGVPFGALICFDNAFARVVREQVEAGARFLAVLSNETWYRGGRELDQMVAMSVFRALETGTPIIRCTVDGASLLVDSRGRVQAALPRRQADAIHPATLRVDLIPGEGALGAVAWLHSLSEAVVLLALLGLLLASPTIWAKIHRRGP
ncbi:MAG: apolipoprotein N-acyltransferase [Planctomycetota bacterium]|jgi:apolipoprotein N-acyltransferase